MSADQPVSDAFGLPESGDGSGSVPGLDPVAPKPAAKAVIIDRRTSPAFILGVVLAVLGTMFIVSNSTRVDVRFVGFSFNTWLWVVILGSMAVGAAIGFLAPHGHAMMRTRRLKQAEKAVRKQHG